MQKIVVFSFEYGWKTIPVHVHFCMKFFSFDISVIEGTHFYEGIISKYHLNLSYRLTQMFVRLHLAYFALRLHLKNPDNLKCLVGVH